MKIWKIVHIILFAIIYNLTSFYPFYDRLIVSLNTDMAIWKSISICIEINALNNLSKKLKKKYYNFWL